MSMFISFDSYGICTGWLDREEDMFFYPAPSGFDPKKLNAAIFDGVPIALNDTDMLEYILSKSRQRNIIELKREGSRRIQTFKGRCYTDIEWMRKSQNYQDIKFSFSVLVMSGNSPTQEQIDLNTDATRLLNRKDRYVERINELEQKLLEMNKKELESFDPLDDKYWTGLD